tara:strand:- start:339 stop:1190 length:852 start_codon:yes stop_codon:yes gene_type:complete
MKDDTQTETSMLKMLLKMKELEERVITLTNKNAELGRAIAGVVEDIRHIDADSILEDVILNNYIDVDDLIEDIDWEDQGIDINYEVKRTLRDVDWTDHIDAGSLLDTVLVGEYVDPDDVLDLDGFVENKVKDLVEDGCDVMDDMALNILVRATDADDYDECDYKVVTKEEWNKLTDAVADTNKLTDAVADERLTRIEEFINNTFNLVEEEPVSVQEQLRKAVQDGRITTGEVLSAVEAGNHLLTQQLESMKKAELVDWMVERGLPVAGKKADLVSRALKYSEN